MNFLVKRLVCFWIVGLVVAGAVSADPQAVVVIENVSVVDVIEGRVIPKQSIQLNGAQIEWVGPAGEAKVPESATRIDAAGLYAIPGLWDMHIHWFAMNSMDLFPINGVTGVRVMWGNPMHHMWREEFEAGNELGPRMVIASSLVDGPNPFWPGSRVAESPAEGVAAVQDAVKAKADFVKVYSLLSRETYLAIASECKRNQLPFEGHVPRMVPILEASNAGQRTMEHLYELSLGCSSEEEAIRQQILDQVKKSGGNVREAFGSEFYLPLMRRAMETYDENKARRLFATFKRNGTWHCPTLTVLRNLAYIDDPSVQDNPDLKYIPQGMRSFLAPKKDPRNRSAQALRDAKQQMVRVYELVRLMKECEVPLLAGTDVLNPFCLPGFSLHGELQLMVDAGLSNAAALQTATINPARYQGKEKTMGSIDAGKVADIVLLGSNPLEEIRATRNIQTVILRGRVLSKQKLDELKRAHLQE